MALLLPPGGLLVAAPPTLLRHGLLLTLREAWPDYPVSCTTDAAQLPALLRQHPCALVVVDSARLPAATLATMLRQLTQQQPHLPLLLLTGRRPLAPMGSPALRQLSCHASPAAVAAAVAELLALAPAAPAADARPLPHPRSAALSPRELEVLALVMADLSNEDIAGRLFVSVRTVESHRRALLQKAGVRTPVGLVVRALREGWMSA